MLQIIQMALKTKAYLMYLMLSTSGHLLVFPSSSFFCLLDNFMGMLFLAEITAFQTQPPSLGRCFLKCICSNHSSSPCSTRWKVLKLTAPGPEAPTSPPASLSRQSPQPGSDRLHSPLAAASSEIWVPLKCTLCGHLAFGGYALFLVLLS